MKMKNLLLTAVATLGLTAATMAQNVPSYVPTNGLVGWWPFNGNANDESGNGNNGTVNGASLTSDRFNNNNTAYNFNGQSDFVQLQNSPTLDYFTDFSISAWVNPNNFNQLFQIIVSKDTMGAPPNGDWDFYLRNNKFNFAITLNTPTFEQSSNASMQSNQWQSVNITREATNGLIKMYVNGVLDTSFIGATGPSFNLQQMVFGKQGSSNQHHFNGKIDDIGIWNRVLNQQEISNLYNGNICYQTITVTDTLVINMGITGFNPVTYNNTIKIFPNPTNDHITINYGNFASLNGYQLKIINSLGQQVFQTNITQQSDYLNLTTWGGNGLYFVHIIDQQGNIIDIRKIVLQ